MMMQSAHHANRSSTGSVPVVGTPPSQVPYPVPPRQRSRVSGSNVVTFTRTSRTGSEGSNVGSQKSAYGSPSDIQQRRSSISDRPPRSFGRSAPTSTTGFQLTRQELVPQHRQDGFNTAIESNLKPTERPSEQREKLEGALSRELSHDRLSSSSHIKERLQKCLDIPTAAPAQRGALPAETSKLLEQLQERHAVFASPLVAHAFYVAAMALEGRTRRDGEPRLLHCAATAAILADMGLDEDTVAAGLLHEVLDISMMTEAQLSKVAAAPVVDMVKNVSRIDQACLLLRAHTESSDANEGDTSKLTTMLLAMADVRAVLVNLAARLHQLRGLAERGGGGGSGISLAEETLRVFAPLANRLGVWSLKAEMEDLCFQVLRPLEHGELAAALREAQSRGHLQDCLTQLKGAMDARGLHYHDLSGRPKNLYGVFSKMQRKGAPLEQVYDVRALRIIVASKEDCYAALREVEKLWAPIEGRHKDYIRRPKENGYKSLHTVVRGPGGVPIEVQIRTSKMHYIAEYGVAAHWRYKEAPGAAPSSCQNDQLVGWARWVITWQLELGDGKTRPSGSPPRDTSLAAFAAAGTCGTQDAEPALCTFPEHSHDCRFAKYLASARLAPSAAGPAEGRPVLVVMLNEAAAPGCAPRIAELPAGVTTGQLLSGGLLGAGVRAGAVRLLVNKEEVHSSHQLLLNGDQVEVFSSDPQEQLPLSSLPYSEDWADVDTLGGAPGCGLDGDRARLNRIYTAVPASCGAAGGRVPWREAQRGARKAATLDEDIFLGLSGHLDALFARPDFLSAR